MQFVAFAERRRARIWDVTTIATIMVRGGNEAMGVGEQSNNRTDGKRA